MTRKGQEYCSDEQQGEICGTADGFCERRPGSELGTPAARAFMQDLLFEHAYLNRILRAFENHLTALRNRGTVDYDIMHEVMHYIVHFPDVYHHPREHLLFECIQAQQSNLEGVVHKLEREHEIGYEQGRRLLTLLEEAKQRVSSRLNAELLSSGKLYIHEMREHMRLEETVMIPRAITLLTEQDLSRIRLELGQRNESLLAPPLNQQDHPGLLAHFEATVRSVGTEASRLESLHALVAIDAVTEFGAGTRRMADIVQRSLREGWNDCTDYCKTVVRAQSPLAWWKISFQAVASGIQRQCELGSELTRAVQETLSNTKAPVIAQVKSLSGSTPHPKPSLPPAELGRKDAHQRRAKQTG
jgi:hemerythrin-like domain-containing protein